MLSLLSVLLLVATVPLVVAVSVILVEIAVGISAKAERSQIDPGGQRPPVVILIPAHNESNGIVPTLFDVRDQLGPNDRLLVVADNCSDDTAEIAAASGAEVVRRNDPERRGKGFALDFGLRSLGCRDPEIVIVVDADCRLGKGALDQLALTCGLTGRPVQALYLMGSSEETIVKHQISEFAWRIKNDLRPRGLRTLGLPCQLMGSGMAFPRKLLGKVNFASGHLAEDLELGLQLARAGHAPLFCPTALITSEFPTTEPASLTQRQRWEHGHLSILTKRVLPCISAAVRQRNSDLFALSCDAAVPPLVLLGFLVLAAVAASAFGWQIGAGLVPLLTSTVALTGLLVSLVLAWRSRGRDLLTAASMASFAPYIGNKVRIYLRAFDRNKKWIRTDRG